jgi:putative colanic acid biosynthesis UDP-glucose lipid carrier transferase
MKPASVFLKPHTSEWVLLLRLLDITSVIVAGTLAYSFSMSDGSEYVAPESAFVLVLGSTLLIFEYFRVYPPRGGEFFRHEVGRLLAAWASVWIVTAVASVPLGLNLTANSYQHWLVLWAGFGCLLICLSRYLLRKTAGLFQDRGLYQRRVALLGLSPVGVAAAQHVNGLPWTNHRVIGYVDDREHARTETGGLTRLGPVDSAAELIDKEGVEEVWIGFPFRGESRVKEALHALRHSPSTVRFLVDVYAFEMLHHSASEIAGVPVMNIHASPLYEGANGLIKEAEDRFLAGVILLLLSPLMLAIAVGVKLSSSGPVFYRQERISWNNRPFTMLKFRTMPVGIECSTGPVWAKRYECRATSFGGFLRRTSLDELPQFINVLAGDMSIVGPRPERPSFVDRFKEEIPLYMKKHMVKAGITGWAQVNGWRGDTDLRKRIEYDLHYIQNWSLALDLKIIIKTLLSGLIHKNAY